MNKKIIFTLGIILAITMLSFSLAKGNAENRGNNENKNQSEKMNFGKCVALAAKEQNNCYQTIRLAKRDCVLNSSTLNITNFTAKSSYLNECAKNYRESKKECKLNFKNSKLQCANLKLANSTNSTQ